MRYEFDQCRLDLETRELSRGSEVVPVEPQVFALLRLLIENRQRVVGRGEIIDRIWDGRIVSDAALSSRVKSARQAIGDDGRAQRLIRTHHGVGFRFTGEVTAHGSVQVLAEPEPPAEPFPDLELALSRPSIAVLPFACVGAEGPYAGIADALPHDLIVDLSRLRWLLVIARGSSFQFRGADATPAKVRAALGVRYCLSGAVEVAGDRLSVTVELVNTEDGGVIWGAVIQDALGAVHEIRARVAQEVVAALELQIPQAEALRAMRSPGNLDAWSAYHLGVAQMYRFDREGAFRAMALFQKALQLDPGFARARAGLSFAHFENAFLGFSAERDADTALARRYAEQSLELDPFDPFCNLVMGRAAWLTGDLDEALPWLDRAIELNPNYAQALYSAAWTLTVQGDGREGRSLTDCALVRSPMDPLLYGMLGVRSLSHMVLDEPEPAALWGERAARAPRAHPLIALIAAAAHALGGDEDRARAWVASARKRRPGLAAADFFQAFPLQDIPARQRISRALQRLDL